MLLILFLAHPAEATPKQDHDADDGGNGVSCDILMTCLVPLVPWASELAQLGQNRLDLHSPLSNAFRFLSGLGGHAHQQAVHQLLMAPEHVSQLRRNCRDGMIVVTWQQLELAFCEPLLGLLSMAFWAGPIAAAVKNPKQTRLFSLQRQCEKSSWTKCCVAGVGSVKPELVGWLVRNGPDVLGV